MRFIIYGAGGIGGTIGARLFQQGEEVVLIARGAHLEAIANNGLRFVTPREHVNLRIPTVGHPSEIDFGHDDVVFLCMKSQHSLAALDDLRAATGEDIAVVCCQNGVANERMALRRFRNTYAMVVILPALHLEPGVVITHALNVGGILDAGRYPQGVDDHIGEVTRLLRDAGFSAEPDAKVMRQKYAKLLMNLNNSLQAATEMRGEAPEISRMMREEALACYRAAGIDCATADETRARRANVLEMGDIPGIPRGGGSSWQSVARGTGDIEVDYLNGEIVMLGRLHGVPTPANEAIQRIAHRMISEKLPPGAITIDEVREMIAGAHGASADAASADAASRQAVQDKPSRR